MIPPLSNLCTIPWTISPLPVLVVPVHDVPLRLPEALHDHLLGGLGGDPPELVGVHLDAEAVPDLGFRVDPVRLFQGDLQVLVGHLLDHLLELEDLDFTRFVVEGDFQVVVGPQLLLGRRLDGLLQGLDQDFPVNALLAAHLINHSFQI